MSTVSVKQKTTIRRVVAINFDDESEYIETLGDRTSVGKHRKARLISLKITYEWANPGWETSWFAVTGMQQQQKPDGTWSAVHSCPNPSFINPGTSQALVDRYRPTAVITITMDDQDESGLPRTPEVLT